MRKTLFFVTAVVMCTCSSVFACELLKAKIQPGAAAVSDPCNCGCATAKCGCMSKDGKKCEPATDGGGSHASECSKEGWFYEVLSCGPSEAGKR